MRDWSRLVAAAVVVTVVFRTFVLGHFVVEGASMSPTLSSGDRVFVNKLAYVAAPPQRGDVIVFRSTAPHHDLVKRVVGLPGERVGLVGCAVLVDGQRLDEQYLEVPQAGCGPDVEPVEVPEGAVFVLGDNRPASLDSRQLGAVPLGDVVGRAFVVVWPSTRAAAL